MELTLCCVFDSTDLISVLVKAQSEDLAKEMFESVWGLGYDGSSVKTGTSRIDPDRLESRSWNWRDKLKQQRRERDATYKGKRCQELISQKWRERKIEKEVDRRVEEALEEEAEHWHAERQKQTKRRKS